MGEQPLFSCKAHVFQLEPELKKSWISLSSAAVNVQIFHDPIKNIYRIVSIEGTKALINSIVTAKMTFTKTSQKFGQWIDFKLNLVYGLGFPNDSELNKFVEKFKEIKEHTRNNHKTHERSNSCEISSTINRHIDQNNDNSELHDKSLRYENDRLKVALSSSSATSRKFEDEIHSLKSEKTLLNKALQESNSTRDELRNQLKFYKEESIRLKNQNLALNSTNSKRNDDFDNISSSSTNSFNLNQNNSTNSTHNYKNSQYIKHELSRLGDSFDHKLRELHKIREEIRQLINDIN